MNKVTPYIINLSRFFGDFTPIVPYMALFFIQHNITISQSSLLFLLWALSILLFEIPTGMLADKINRKTILVASRALKLSCFVVWLLFPTFIGFAIGFILWGLATALDSGAFQAFLYDHLHDHNAHDLFSKHYGNASSWSFAGLLCSALIAAGLIHLDWNYDALLIFSIISMTMSEILFIFAPSPTQNISQSREESLFSNIRSNTASIWKSNELLIVFVIGITAGGIKGSLEEYYPLLLGTKEVALPLIGISIAGFELMKSLGSFLAGHIQKSRISQLFLLSIIGLLIMSIGVIHGIFLITAIAALTLIDAFLWILNDTAVQDMSNSNNRATIASYKNFGTEFIALLAFFVFSITTATYPISSVYIVGGIIIVGISMLLSIKHAKVRYFK